MGQIVLEAIEMLSKKEHFINQIDAHVIHIYADLTYRQIEWSLADLQHQGKISITPDGIVNLTSTSK